MKHLKKILAIALVALTLMAVAMPAMAVTMYTNGSGTNVRNSKRTDIPNIHYTIRNTGTAVNVGSLESSNYTSYKWWTYYYDSNTRYIAETALTSTDPNGGGGTNPGTGLNGNLYPPVTSFITGTNVRIRLSPVNGTVLGQTNASLTPTQYVKVNDKQLGSDGYYWYYIEHPNAYGWIQGRYLAGA